jgi:serine/threonine protein kinase
MQIKNFHITRTIERNTLSELFLARHVHEDYYVKIRLFDQMSITNEEIREAILQRLRNSFQMRHRNVIATLDYGIEGRYMYQIQEHMDLGTLEDLLHKTPQIPPEIAGFILQELLRGLHYAHSIGIFHGMLNPSKVLLSSSGIVKIDDFQYLDVKNTFLKQVQTRIKAKQQMYLAPEHLLGKEADYRCDLFSAGVIAYKMLTGKHPFLEEQAEWTTMQIIACNSKLLFELDPTLPTTLEELIERMMEKELTQRVQSAEEALRCLELYVTNFGEVRSYEVLSNFLKKPQPSVEQLNLLRAEEFLQQAAQFQLQENWDKALIAYSRAQFLKPKDKQIETEIKSIQAKQGYVPGEGNDSKLLQMEQTLKANPENIQVLQRLATLAKSKGDLIRCVVYYKRILKIHREDPFALSQLRQLLQNQDRDAVLSPTEVKWTRWQDFYRAQQQPVWRRWNFAQGNFPLLAAVLILGVTIGILHWARLLPETQLLSASPAFQQEIVSATLINQKVEMICEQAAVLYKQGEVDKAVEFLSKFPLPAQGIAAAHARLLTARYLVDLNSVDKALSALDGIHLPSANYDQQLAVYKMKAAIYRRQGRYGHAIDQYINIKTLPGLPLKERIAADSRIQSLQDEAMANQ